MEGPDRQIEVARHQRIRARSGDGAQTVARAAHRDRRCKDVGMQGSHRPCRAAAVGRAGDVDAGGVRRDRFIRDEAVQQLHRRIQIVARLQLAVRKIRRKGVAAGVGVSVDPLCGMRGALRRDHDACIVGIEHGGVERRTVGGQLRDVVTAARAVAVHVEKDGVGLAACLIAFGQIVAVGDRRAVRRGEAASEEYLFGDLV